MDVECVVFFHSSSSSSSRLLFITLFSHSLKIEIIKIQQRNKF